VDTHTMEYYSATRRDKILPFGTTWMDLAGMMLSEIGQRSILYEFIYIYIYIKPTTNEQMDS